MGASLPWVRERERFERRRPAFSFPEVTPFLLSPICGAARATTVSGNRLDPVKPKRGRTLAMGPAARVQRWVNLESGGAPTRLYICVIHAGNSSFPSRACPIHKMGKGKGARVTLGRATFLAVFLPMHPIRSRDVTFRGQLAAQSVFHFKQKAQIYSIQVFISSSQGSQVSSDPDLHLNSE